MKLKKKVTAQVSVIEGDTLAEWEAATEPCEGSNKKNGKSFGHCFFLPNFPNFESPKSKYVIVLFPFKLLHTS